MLSAGWRASGESRNQFSAASRNRFGAASRNDLILVALAAAVFFLLSLSSSLVKSPMWDEPRHIAAGLSYVETGQIVANQEHPPLMKELAGLSLRAAGVRWPANAPPVGELLDGGLLESTGVGIIANNGPDKVLFWSRLPFILMGTGFVFVLYELGRELLGRKAALGAVFLLALDPIMLAHTMFVATDVGAAVFTAIFLLALWRYLLAPGNLRLLWCGLALGAALGAKFSVVVMLPVTALLLACAAVWPVSGSDDKMPRRPSLHTLARYGLALVGMLAIAFAVMQYLYLFPRNLFQYVAGMRMVNANHVANYLYCMAGQFQRRFYSYYAVAYLLKEPLAAILAAGVGLAAVLRNRKMSRLALAFLLVPPAALFAGYTLFSDDMGVRYIVPALPFLHLLGGAGLAYLFGSAIRWHKWLGGFCCVWIIVAAAGIYPDQLSYFNEAACLLDDPSNLGWDGGSRCGPAWLDDSNVDWGQGLKQLKSWIDRNAQGRQVRVGYFGSFPPAVYGVAVTPSDYADVIGGTKPGLYAVSAEIVAHARDKLPGHGEWMLRTKPVAVAAHTYYIFDLPGAVPGMVPGAVGGTGR